MRRRGLPGRCQEGNIIKEGCRSKGHIIKDGVVDPVNRLTASEDT